jgi:KipI family sensor histidine kinase inhibitor
MTRPVPVGEVRLLGDRAVLVGVPDAAAARALADPVADALAGAGFVVPEVVCGFATVGVVLADADADAALALAVVGAAAAAALGARTAGDPRATDEARCSRVVRVPCVFDGEDLEEVAVLARCSPAEVVTLLTAEPLGVAVLGFAPGFAYLDGVPDALRRVPRRATPRPHVPAGSLALANGHAAVYPLATPGGWQLVGRTGLPLFSTRPPYAVLAPGDRVRLVVAGPGEPREPPPLRSPDWSPPAGARAVFDVEAPGLRTAVQDGGRRGVAAAGVPRAGPADPLSFALSNALVGNPADAGALEITGGGTRLRARAVCHVAAAGAAPELSLDGDGAPGGQVLPVGPGQTLAVRRLGRGCRTYLSVAGGIVGPHAFGSAATDELCRLGPGALGGGATVWAGRWDPPLGDHLEAGAASELEPGRPVELRVVAGPHPERFRPDALAVLAGAVFRVGPDSNRVGVRLRAPEGTPPLRRADQDAAELDSQCVVTGAVQVPPGGDPVVLLPDHATLGGYPVVAVVASADHGLLGQCAPGTAVRLVPISADDAERARRARRRALGSAVVGHYPLRAG